MVVQWEELQYVATFQRLIHKRSALADGFFISIFGRISTAVEYATVFFIIIFRIYAYKIT